MENKNQKTTIYEVAERSGVSTTTVSRVLNDSPKVSETTKERILEVIDELNYTPKLMAQNLATGNPQTLAIVVPSFTTPYFNEILKGIKDKIGLIDLDIMLHNTGSKNREQDMQQFFNQGMADAVILLSVDITEKVHKQLQQVHTPTVLVNAKHPEYSYFGLDDFHGGYIAGEYLAKKGFKTIGMISSAMDTKNSTKRKNGFMKALEDYEIEINEDHLVSGDTTKHSGFTEESGVEAIQKLNKSGDFPEVIFCVNDTQALGAMYELSKLGLRVPDDIAIMGYDNIKQSKYLDLTTIDQKMYSVGAEAIKQLAELINNPQADLRQEVMEPALIERGSTRRKIESPG